MKVLMDEVVEVVKWFINHSYALGVFNEEQQSMTGKNLALITPVITRWTAYFLSMDRLVTVWKPLQITSIKHKTALLESVGHKPKAKKKAQQVLSHVHNDTWWAKVVWYIVNLTILRKHNHITLIESKHKLSHLRLQQMLRKLETFAVIKSSFC